MHALNLGTALRAAARRRGRAYATATRVGQFSAAWSFAGVNDAVRDIVLLGDPVLHKPCDPVYGDKKRGVAPLGSHDIAAIAHQLRSTAAHHNAFGLAAPQLGYLFRMFVMARDWSTLSDTHQATYEDYDVIVDPQIDSLCSKDKDVHVEQCLSVPGIQGIVARPNCLRASYYDLTSCDAKQAPEKPPRPTKRRVVRFAAQIFQHELDHLDGVLYMDRMQKGSEGLAVVPPRKGLPWSMS